MRFLFLIGVIALCATSSINAKSLEESNAEALSAVRGSVNTFGLNFLKTVAAKQGKNLICSPLSVSTALSILYFGARQNTRDQLRNGLALPDDDTVVRTGYSKLLKTLDKFTRVELRMANNLLLDYFVQPKPSFTSVITKDFRSEVQILNFGNPQQVSDAVNAWSGYMTNDRIKDILKPGDVDSTTALVLVNAVYFKGSWNSKFNVTDTKDLPFHINAKDQIKVPTMYQYDSFTYGNLPEVDATYLKLYYEINEDTFDDTMQMIIVRPNTVDGLAKVIKGLDKRLFEQIQYYGSARQCHVYLPKFKIESKLPLEGTLQSMHMTDMFNEALSNFTGIVDSPSLAVSKIVQKAFIEVNEEGSEAAATTSIGLSYKFGQSEEEQDVTFKVDRPFLALITAGLDEPTIVFASTWYGPQ